jgi:uncharacterized protein
MKNFTFTLILLLILSLNCSAADNSPALDPSGNWSGALNVGAIKLRLALKITRTNAGFVGTLDSIDQGANGIPISSVRFQKPAVVLEIKSIAAEFNGVLADDGLEMSGQWNQGGQSFPLAFKRGEKPLKLNRPQEPKVPYSYREELITFTNSKAGVKLAGTLTLPKEGDHFPAVVLITGSGAQDRDESLMGHKPFLVLADFLTRQGIAVLRLDDRGVGGSTGNLMTSSDEELTEDILTAVAWLKQRSDIDPKQIGLIGHSEGGIIAPLAAVRSPEIAFIVLMAGPGVPMNELLQTQAAEIARANGLNEELISRIRQFQSRAFDILKSQPDDQLAEKALRELWDEVIKNFTVEEQKQIGLADAGSTGQIKIMLTPWFRNMLAYEPRSTLVKVSCPVLALNGEKDLQVSSKDNLAGIAAALKAGGNHDFQTVELQGLNHLFQTCKTGLPAEYGEIEETISPSALKLMADWIRRRANLDKEHTVITP